MNITDAEIRALQNCTTENQWNDVCNQIKEARQGEYPPDWWAKVKLSGLMAKTTSKWGGTDQLTVRAWSGFALLEALILATIVGTLAVAMGITACIHTVNGSPEHCDECGQWHAQ